MHASNCAVLCKYEAWDAEKRPASAVDQLLEWKLNISELKSAVSGVVSSGAECGLNSSEYILQGQPAVNRDAGNMGSREHSSGSDSSGFAPPSASVTLYLKAGDLKGPAARRIMFQLVYLAAAPARDGAARHYNIRTGTCHIFFVENGTVGLEGCFNFGAVSSWDAVVTALQNMGLVHADGCLHIRAEICEIN